eukprot:2392801-Rhodomonas_salina.2
MKQFTGKLRRVYAVRKMLLRGVVPKFAPQGCRRSRGVEAAAAARFSRHCKCASLSQAAKPASEDSC